MQKVAVFSKKISNIKNINNFFPDLCFMYKNTNKQANAIAGWGYRLTTIKARKYAIENQLPFISLEDGFLRSVGLGLDGFSPLSLIADKLKQENMQQKINCHLFHLKMDFYVLWGWD